MKTLPIITRSCGSCRHCCVDLEIGDEAPEIAHANGTPCSRLGVEGCTRYDERPENPCRTFTCIWLRGFGEETLRPDVSGIMLHEIGGTPKFGATVIATELRPGALVEHADMVKQIGFSIPIITVDVFGSRRLSFPAMFHDKTEEQLRAEMEAELKASRD